MAGTTAKGLPYPTGTDRVMDGDNAIQALAGALDFSRSMAMASTTSASALLATYPDGWSVLSLSSTQAAAGGWPDGVSCQIITLKYGSDRASQWWYRANTTYQEVKYRQISASAVGAWQNYSDPVTSGLSTLVWNNSQAAILTVTLPAGRFLTPPNIVCSCDNATVFLVGPSNITTTSFTLNGRYYVPSSPQTVNQPVHWIAH